MLHEKHFDRVISVEKNGWIATINLVCPQNYNQVNLQWVDEMSEALQDLEEDHNIRVILMKSPEEDHHFVGPGDMDLMIDPIMMKGVSYARECMRLIGGVVQKMYKGSKPIIAVLDGITDGGGFGITLACDIILASERGGFDFYMHALSCLPPDCGGMYGLQRLVGPQMAKYLCLKPGPVMAEEAKQLGLVAEVVPHEELEARAQELAESIARLSPYGVSGIKQLSNRFADDTLETFLERECEVISAGLNGHDWKIWDEAYRQGKECPPEEYTGN